MILFCLAVMGTAFAVGIADRLTYAGVYPWRVDGEYGSALTLAAPNYLVEMGSDITETADALQIYCVRQHHADFFAVNEILHRKVAFESRDRAHIITFLHAIQQGKDAQGALSPIQSDKWHVLVFDRTLLRVGYFWISWWSDGLENYGFVQTLDGSGYFARIPRAILGIDPCGSSSGDMIAH
jgi:hypothetical protein